MDKLFYLLTEGTIGKKVRIDCACAYHVGTDLRNRNQYVRKEGRKIQGKHGGMDNDWTHHLSLYPWGRSCKLFRTPSVGPAWKTTLRPPSQQMRALATDITGRGLSLSVSRSPLRPDWLLPVLISEWKDGRVYSLVFMFKSLLFLSISAIENDDEDDRQ